jgi:hypothetical protein
MHPFINSKTREKSRTFAPLIITLFTHEEDIFKNIICRHCGATDDRLRKTRSRLPI